MIDALEEALAHYVALRESGELPDVDAISAEHGTSADALREAVATYEACFGVDAAPEERAGRTLGDFRIVREIGRGGMGVVYEAEQLSLRRRVALKVLAAHVTLEPREIERFAREASTAARLRHPGIVEVFAVGEDDGVHFFAMELVDGTPLDRWTAPSIEDACRIGEQVAQALDFAHREGVVHRDVKPSNVIVTADGRALLTDFGLAREQGLESLTRTGRFLGTPHYVPPEQAAAGGAPVDARADVWALGVTLFEVLTGERPFEGASAHEVLAKILVKEPPNPSRLNPRIAIDLSTIVLKAMEKDPARRYSSAGALAADLRAFLEGRTIAARPVGAPARAARWARRNPAAACALASTFLLVVGGPIFFGIRERIERERTETTLEIAKADFELARAAVDQMLTRVAKETLRDEPRMEALRKELLVAALGLYQQFVARHGQSPVARAETARAKMHLAEIQDLLGEDVAATALWAEASAELEALGREHSDDRALRRDEAACRRDRAGVLSVLGRVDEARAEAAKAVELAKALADEAPGDESAALGLAFAEAKLADVEFKAGKRDVAVKGLAKCAERFRLLLPKHPEIRVELVRKLADQAWALQSLRQLEEAEAVARDAVDVAQGSTTDERDARAKALHVLAGVLTQMNESKEALPFQIECVELRRALVEEFPRSARFRFEIANALMNLAGMLTYLGEPRSDETARDALAQFERLAQDFPEKPDHWSKLAGCMHNVASQLLPRDPAAALSMLDQAIAHQNRAIAGSPKHPEFKRIMSLHVSQRARALLALGRLEDAELASANLATSFPESWEALADAAAVLGLCLDAMEPQARDAHRARLTEAALQHLRAAEQKGLPLGATKRPNLAFLRDSDGFESIVARLASKP